MEFDKNQCYVYSTEIPTDAPCHVKNAKVFVLDVGGSFSKDDILEELNEHATFIQQGWHTLYKIDDYATGVLETLPGLKKTATKNGCLICHIQTRIGFHS